MRILIVLLAGVAIGVGGIGLLRPNPEATDAASRLRQAEELLDRSVGPMEFNEVPYEQAIQRLALEARVPVRIDKSVLRASHMLTEDTLSLSATRLSLGEWMAEVAHQFDATHCGSQDQLDWDVVDGTLIVRIITAKTPAIASRLMTRRYELQGLGLTGNVDEDSQHVRTLIDYFAKDDLLNFRYRVAFGHLYATATASEHVQIRRLLAEMKLRSAQPRQQIPVFASWHKTLKKWVSSESTETEAAMLKVMPEFQFTGARADAIRAWAKATQLDVSLEVLPEQPGETPTQKNIDAWSAVMATPVDVRLKNVPAFEALRHLLQKKPWPLTWRYEGSVIRIVDSDTASDAISITRIYDIGDWTRRLQARATPPVTASQIEESIHFRIMESVARFSWHDQGGTVGNMKLDGDHLYVRQTPENHLLLWRFLNDLAHDHWDLPKPAPATVPAGRAGE